MDWNIETTLPAAPEAFSGIDFGRFEKVVPLIKIVETPDGRHEAYGMVTAEEPDRDNEICDYNWTAPSYRKLGLETLKATSSAGQEPSMGPVRLQHGMTIAGKLTRIDFNDAKKQIHVAVEPADDKIWDMLKRGLVTGLSQGGRYEKRVCDSCLTPIAKGNDCSKCGKRVLVRYGAQVSEVSMVDRPALPSAVFQSIKSDGTVELCKFSSYDSGAGSVSAVEEVVKGSTGVQFVIGFKAGGGGSEVQSVLFDRDHFDKEKAISWLKSNDFKGLTMDETSDKLRFRQHDPEKYSRLRTIAPGEQSKADADQLHDNLEALGKDSSFDIDSTPTPVATRTKCPKCGKLPTAPGRGRTGCVCPVEQVDKPTMDKSASPVLRDSTILGRFADILQTIAYTIDAVGVEGETEQDPSDLAIAREMREWLEDGVAIFMEYAREEAEEVEEAKGERDPSLMSTGLAPRSGPILAEGLWVEGLPEKAERSVDLLKSLEFLSAPTSIEASLAALANLVKADDSGDHWVTINGHHIELDAHGDVKAGNSKVLGDKAREASRKSIESSRTAKDSDSHDAAAKSHQAAAVAHRAAAAESAKEGSAEGEKRHNEIAQEHEEAAGNHEAMKHGILRSAIGGGIKGGATGAAVGAAAGAMLGSTAAGLGAIPGALVMAPSGAATGASIGAAVGAYRRYKAGSDEAGHKLESRMSAGEFKAESAAGLLKALEALSKFSPDQARGSDGKWTKEGAEAASASAIEATRAANSKGLEADATDKTSDRSKAKAAHEDAKMKHLEAARGFEAVGDTERSSLHHSAALQHEQEAERHSERTFGGRMASAASLAIPIAMTAQMAMNLLGLADTPQFSKAQTRFSRILSKSEGAIDYIDAIETLSALGLVKFSPSQPRDDSGKWTSGGASGERAKEATGRALSSTKVADASGEAPDHKTAARDHMEASSAHEVAAHEAVRTGDIAGAEFHARIAAEHKQAASNHRNSAKGSLAGYAAGGAIGGALGGALAHNAVTGHPVSGRGLGAYAAAGAVLNAGARYLAGRNHAARQIEQSYLQAPSSQSQSASQ